MTAYDAADSTRMVTALVRLRQALADAVLPLDLPGSDGPRLLREELVAQLEDYVIPRMMTLEAPLLAVVGGSTGAGKSTLVNSLVGERVTTPGLLRPTTRSPVLVHHPDDAAWFGQDRLLPDLVRVSESTNDPNSLQLVASDKVPAGLAILDAPDVDSVERENRVLAGQLLAAADLWLFVTSAARYADQVPWEYLRAAAERSTAVAVVLDRTPSDAVQTVATHLARMLASRGLKDSPLFIVNEARVTDAGLLKPKHVAEIRGWLEMLAADVGARQAVVQQTLDGAVRSVARKAHPLADAAREQADAADALRSAAATAYDEVLVHARASVSDGSMMRGEVLARWQEFVGTGELLRSLETRVGTVRDRLVHAIKGKPRQSEHVLEAMQSGLDLLLLEHAERAAGQAELAWRELASGPAMLATSTEDLSRASRHVRRSAERAVQSWQTGVVALIQDQGADKRSTARFLAFGVNGLAVALMVAVFTSHTDGAPGTHAGAASAATAAEPSTVGRALLDAVFGAEAAADLVERARTSLERTVEEILGAERSRYTTLVDGLGLVPGAGDQVRAAARRVDDARFAAQQGSGESD